MLEAAERLPQARRRIARDLAREGMPLERANAVAVRLLDVGYFRIGSDVYADEHGSFGLTTLRRHHVRKRSGVLVFTFTGKSGVEHTVRIDDGDVVAALDRMRRRRDGSDRLMAYQSRRRWADLDAEAVNAYLAETFDGELTAKDFRTWHATVLAATALAVTGERADSARARTRAVRAAVEEVAQYLGNTPAVARSSYIDPRVIDLYENGVTVAAAARRRHRDPSRRQAALERAVLEMLKEH